MNVPDRGRHSPFRAAFPQLEARLFDCGLLHDGVDHAPALDCLTARAEGVARYCLYVDWVNSGVRYPVWLDGLQEGSGWDRVYECYPGLERRLARLADCFLESIRELTSRLAKDRKALAENFGIATGDPMMLFDPGLSDPHRGGRTVIRILFRSGRSIIYKPKPLATEAAINKFMAVEGASFGIRSLTVLDRGAYGWVEDAGPARRLDQPESRNPEMLGRATAFFWLCNTTDLHSENVLPGEDGVACLDLETVFLAPWRWPRRHWRDHSVTATLLFDASAFAHARTANISGFDPTPSNGSFLADVAFKVADDRIVAAPVQAVTAGDTGHALVDPSSDAAEFRAFRAGFKDASDIAVRRRLLEFLECLSDDMLLRFVARETFQYGQIGRRMVQPRFLRSGVAQRADLELLHDSNHAPGPEHEALSAVIEDEIRQLQNGDVPYFSYCLGSMALILSDGTSIDVFADSARAHARRKMTGAETADIDEQLALVSVAKGLGPPSHSSDTPPNDPVKQIGWLSSRILKAMMAPAQAPARWLTLQGDVSKQDLLVSAGGEDLYGGSLGILLALQAAEAVTAGGSEISRFLDDQCRGFERIVADPHRGGFGLGFSGHGGAFFVAAELLRHAPERWCGMLDAISSRLSGLEDKIVQDRALDVVGGSAGLLIGLARLKDIGLPAYEKERVEALSAFARLHIVNSAKRKAAGLAWYVPWEEKPLLGYAHGWAGIVSALLLSLDAFEAKGVKEFATLSESLAYLKGDYELNGAFIEHRSGEGAGQSLNRSWCNGTAGFLRGACARRLPSARWLAHAVGPLRNNAIEQLGRSRTYRFCCGELGVVDCLLDLARADGDTRQEAVVKRAGADLLDRALCEIAGPASDLVPETAFPGLFQNIAGILYVACRLRSPDLISLSGQEAKLLRPLNSEHAPRPINLRQGS